jgi:hypothetical protein
MFFFPLTIIGVVVGGGLTNCSRQRNIGRGIVRRDSSLACLSSIEKRSETTKMKLTRAGPAPVHKLGHFGLCVTDFARTYDFFTSRFNFKASDVRPLPSSPPLPKTIYGITLT